MGLLGSLFKNTSSPLDLEIKTALDLVTYAGSLASNPVDIDPLLDDVRKITALHPVDGGLSPADEQTLFDVYLKLESYLTNNDPIRTYTKEELRSRVDATLLTKLTAHEAQGGL